MHDEFRRGNDIAMAALPRRGHFKRGSAEGRAKLGVGGDPVGQEYTSEGPWKGSPPHVLWKLSP